MLATSAVPTAPTLLVLPQELHALVSVLVRCALFGLLLRPPHCPPLPPQFLLLRPPHRSPLPPQFLLLPLPHPLGTRSNLSNALLTQTAPRMTFVHLWTSLNHSSLLLAAPLMAAAEAAAMKAEAAAMKAEVAAAMEAEEAAMAAEVAAAMAAEVAARLAAPEPSQVPGKVAAFTTGSLLSLATLWRGALTNPLLRLSLPLPLVGFPSSATATQLHHPALHFLAPRTLGTRMRVTPSRSTGAHTVVLLALAPTRHAVPTPPRLCAVTFLAAPGAQQLQLHRPLRKHPPLLLLQGSSACPASTVLRQRTPAHASQLP